MDVGTLLPPYPYDVPPGGSAGQIAVRATGGVSWQTGGGAMPWCPVYASGQWYDTRMMESGSFQNTGFLGAAVFYAPVWLPAPTAVSAIGCPYIAPGNATSTPGTMTFAGYTALASGMPGTRLGQYSYTMATGAPVAAASGAVSFTFPAGWNYLAFGNTGGPNGLAATLAHALSALPFTSVAMAGPNEVVPTYGMGALQDTTVAGVPPATASTTNTVVYNNFSGLTPVLAFRVA